VKPAQQGWWVGEELPVPSVAGPAGGVVPGFGQVPSPCRSPTPKAALPGARIPIASSISFVLGVAPVVAPPVAKRPGGTSGIDQPPGRNRKDTPDNHVRSRRSRGLGKASFAWRSVAQPFSLKTRLSESSTRPNRSANSAQAPGGLRQRCHPASGRTPQVGRRRPIRRSAR